MSLTIRASASVARAPAPVSIVLRIAGRELRETWRERERAEDRVHARCSGERRLRAFASQAADLTGEAFRGARLAAGRPSSPGWVHAEITIAELRCSTCGTVAEVTSEGRCSSCGGPP